MTPRLCRTFQTAPTAVPRDDTAKYLRRGFTSAGFEVPDWLVPDVEDGTAPKMKEEVDAGLPEGSIEIRVFIKLCPGVYHGGRLRIAFRDVGESAVDGRVRPSEHGTASVPGPVNYPCLLAAVGGSLRQGLPGSTTRFAGTTVVPVGSAVSTGVSSE